MNEQIVILDFGSQYTQVIARRVRECNVYSTIMRFDTPADGNRRAEAERHYSVRRAVQRLCAKTRRCRTRTIFELGVPVLGICFGVQLFAQFLGGKVEKGLKREYGKGTLTVKDKCCALFAKLPANRCRSGIRTATSSRNFPTASNPSPSRKIPNTPPLKTARRNFSACSFIPKSSTRRAARKSFPTSSTASAAAARDWTMRNYVEQAVAEIRAQVGKEHVILGLSGGVDSSVAAALLHKAIGDQLTCIFVNNGVLRAREAEVVQEVFGRNFKIKLQYEDASKLFLDAAQGRDRSRTQTQDHRQDVHRGFSGARPSAPARRSSSRKARCIPTSSNPCRLAAIPPRSSRAITTSAACRRT